MSRHCKALWLAAALAFGIVAGAADRPALAQGAKSTDPFGESVTLTAKTIVASKGTATWDNAYDTLVEALKAIDEARSKGEKDHARD